MDNSEKYWDKRSNKYDKQTKRYGQTYIRTIENTKKHLTMSDVVLDYACGTGNITNEIADNVKEIHAIDISAKMLDIAKRKAGERKIENINFAQSTIFDETYQKESFHVILVFNVLHLLADPQKVIRRINELLKPGGLFISATGCLGEKKTFSNIFFLLLSKVGMVPFIKFFKISELEDLITNENFQIVETENLYHTPPNYFIVAKKI